MPIKPQDDLNIQVLERSEREEKRGLKRLVFEQLLEDENLAGIARYVARNKKFISNANSGKNVLKAEGWDRTTEEQIEFNLRHYRFLFITTREEWYDTREDDGCSSGWTTKNAERKLIIKDKDNVRLRITGSKYIKQMYELVYDLIEDLVGVQKEAKEIKK